MLIWYLSMMLLTLGIINGYVTVRDVGVYVCSDRRVFYLRLI